MQRTILLFIFFLSSLISFSQNSFIVNKKGEKIIVKDNSTSINSIDRRISYKLPNGTWEKYIKFKDLDYIIDESYKIKAFKLEGKTKYDAYYIHTDSNGKILGTIYYTNTTTKTNSSDFSDYTYSNSYRVFEYYIIENNKVVKEGSFFDGNKMKVKAKHSEFISDIKTHFNDCNALIERLKKAEKDTSENNYDYQGYIFQLFTSPVYIKNCN